MLSFQPIESFQGPSNGLSKKSFYINDNDEYVNVPDQCLMKILLVNQFVSDFGTHDLT